VGVLDTVFELTRQQDPLLSLPSLSLSLSLSASRWHRWDGVEAEGDIPVTSQRTAVL
jgi:hypothetical protein